MTIEAEVSTAEETQNQSAEQTQETPEVVTPENVEAIEQEQAPQKSEETDVERERKRFQRRMDRRTAELYRERAEREALAARLSQYEQQQPSEQQPAKADPVAIAREIAAVERFTEKCNAIAAEGAKKFPDFNEALTAFTAEVGPIADRNGKPTAIGQVLLEAESPAEVLRYLGKNPDVAADLADLTPTQLARRMDRIERDMKEAAKPKVSNAPKPLKPVTGGGTAVKDPSQMSDAEWREWRLANK